MDLHQFFISTRFKNGLVPFIGRLLFWSEVLLVTYYSHPLLYLTNYESPMIYFSQGNFTKRGDG